jgi:CHAT domain-containing protein
VGNPLPLPPALAPLEFAATEAAAIAGEFGGKPRLLVGQEATRADVEAMLWKADHLHLACHGQFDPLHPLETSLVLAHGERLTVRDLLDGQPLAEAGRPLARLAVLSACESALIESERTPDEAVGLPAVFLQAGVPGVVGSLWQVDDLSTALLMIHFYEQYLRGDTAGEEGTVSPTTALRRAQLWLREATTAELRAMVKRRESGCGPSFAGAVLRLALEEPLERPFRDPYHWAPFVCVGV